MLPCECQDPCDGIYLRKAISCFKLLSSVLQRQGNCSISGIRVLLQTPGYVIRFGGPVLYILHGKLCRILLNSCMIRLKNFQNVT